jgi:hypothetical protein
MDQERVKTSFFAVAAIGPPSTTLPWLSKASGYHTKNKDKERGKLGIYCCSVRCFLHW